MDRKTFHHMKALSAMCLTAWQQRKHIEASHDWSLNHTTASLRSQLKSLRENNREPTLGLGARNRERGLIIGSVNSMYDNSRKSVSASPGKELRSSGDEVNGRPRFNFTVRWGWYRKVYLPFYQDDRLDCHDYFVMAVEQVRVNHPHITLYEATAYEFKTRRERIMWVGQTKIGERRAAIKETSSDAIRAAISLFDKQFKKDLTEKNDERQ